jgi:hypothetical protein
MIKNAIRNRKVLSLLEQEVPSLMKRFGLNSNQFRLGKLKKFLEHFDYLQFIKDYDSYLSYESARFKIHSADGSWEKRMEMDHSRVYEKYWKYFRHFEIIAHPKKKYNLPK